MVVLLEFKRLIEAIVILSNWCTSIHMGTSGYNEYEQSIFQRPTQVIMRQCSQCELMQHLVEELVGMFKAIIYNV